MPLNRAVIKKIVKGALAEDAAYQDITTLSFIPQETRVKARIVAKEKGVVCGIFIAREVFKTFDSKLLFKVYKKDGQKVGSGNTVVILEGRARSILSCERVALNFLSTLCGISTQTYKAVSRVRSKGIQILDTRKTTPLLRAFEKYAVLMGQGKNHRFDLSNQYLVKDNHLFILKKTRGLEALAGREKNIPFEIEVESLRDLTKALSYCPDIVMLDNFTPQDIKKAIHLIRRYFPNKEKRPLIELSGGITLENISRFAIKGVDFISLGALTHSARALDLSLDITKVYR